MQYLHRSQTSKGVKKGPPALLSPQPPTHPPTRARLHRLVRVQHRVGSIQVGLGGMGWGEGTSGSDASQLRVLS